MLLSFVYENLVAAGKSVTLLMALYGFKKSPRKLHQSQNRPFIYQCHMKHTVYVFHTSIENVHAIGAERRRKQDDDKNNDDDEMMR